MDLRQSTPSKAANSAPPVPQPESQLRNEPPRDIRAELRNSAAHVPASNSSGYGLPCSKCHLYYPANLDFCPTCHDTERVSAEVAPAIPAKVAVDPEPDAPVLEEVLDQEREAFLKQFKSQLLAADAEAGTAATAACTLPHQDEIEAAAICKSCYERLQERVDVLEAALHIDLKEAAQIVYDAVWADPSDPSKTYANAAGALLAELRKRSGVSSLLGPFQPLGN
jgi:hypothetical protein